MDSSTVENKIQLLIALNQQIIALMRVEDWEPVAEMLQVRHKGYQELFVSFGSEILAAYEKQLKLLKQVDKQLLLEAQNIYRETAANIFDFRRADKARKSYTQFL